MALRRDFVILILLFVQSYSPSGLRNLKFLLAQLYGSQYFSLEILDEFRIKELSNNYVKLTRFHYEVDS